MDIYLSSWEKSKVDSILYFFLFSNNFWFFLDWCSDVFVPSVFINETLFFSVSKHKFYLVWNQVVGTLLTFKHVVVSKLHWRSFQSMDQSDSVISAQYLMFWCYYEDQCSKWILFLNSVPVDLMNIYWLEVWSPPPPQPNRFKISI